MTDGAKTHDGGLEAGLVADGVGEILVGADDIARRVREIGEQITDEYRGRKPLMVVVLKGAVLFSADLIRAIDLPVEIDFMAVSSYGASTRSSGVVRIMKDLDVDITGRDVILVEDIVDSGLTLQYLRKSINARGPASLAVCALLLREEDAADAADGAGAPVNGVASTPIEYVGFRLPKVWVVGYGLDLDQRYRNLPDIRAFDEDH